MLEQARQRTESFQIKLKSAGIDIALITDESSIAYLAGFWGYLSVEFGRPTFLLLPADEPPIVITPLMESEMQVGFGCSVCSGSYVTHPPPRHSLAPQLD